MLHHGCCAHGAGCDHRAAPAPIHTAPDTGAYTAIGTDHTGTVAVTDAESDTGTDTIAFDFDPAATVTRSHVKPKPDADVGTVTVAVAATIAVADFDFEPAGVVQDKSRQRVHRRPRAPHHLGQQLPGRDGCTFDCRRGVRASSDAW